MLHPVRMLCLDSNSVTERNLKWFLITFWTALNPFVTSDLHASVKNHFSWFPVSAGLLMSQLHISMMLTSAWSVFVDETVSWAHAAGLSVCQLHWTKTRLLIWEQWAAVSQICLNTRLILYRLHNISVFQTGNAGTVMIWLQPYEKEKKKL